MEETTTYFMVTLQTWRDMHLQDFYRNKKNAMDVTILGITMDCL